MTEKVKLFACIMILAATLMVASFAAGWSLRGRPTGASLPSDTILVTRVDTVTVTVAKVDTLTRIVYKLLPVSVHDTTLVVKHTTDSIYLSLPYEHRHWSQPDTLDVWYSGMDARVDSAKVYNTHTVEVVNHYNEVAKMPALTFDIGAGTAVVGGTVGQPTAIAVRPYGITRLSYNRPHATFSAYGRIDTQGAWGAGVDVTYKVTLIR